MLTFDLKTSNLYISTTHDPNDLGPKLIANLDLGESFDMSPRPPTLTSHYGCQPPRLVAPNSSLNFLPSTVAKLRRAILPLRGPDLDGIGFATPNCTSDQGMSPTRSIGQKSSQPGGGLGDNPERPPFSTSTQLHRTTPSLRGPDFDAIRCSTLDCSSGEGLSPTR